MNADRVMAAQKVIEAVEGFANESEIGWRTAELARTLGGTADVSRMSPGAAAVYLLALIVRDHTNGR